MGCGDGRKSFLGPFVGNKEEEWDKVEKRMRTRTTQWAAVLGVARAVDLANRADIPLAVDTNMAKVVAFEA